MAHSISVETTSLEMWNHLLSLHLDGVTVSRAIRLGEDSKLKLLAVFASGVAVNLFSSALYDALVNFQPHETTIDGKQVTANKIQIGVLINSHVQVNQSNTETECNKNGSDVSHGPQP